MIAARVVAIVAFAVPLAATAAAHDYRFDTVHTQITVGASHLGFSQSSGRLRVRSGWFRFDPDDWSAARVDAVIDAASIDFGDAAWNDKLRSREFLDTARYPTARFFCDRVEKTGEKTAIAHGKLTLAGVTRPLDLAIALNRVAVHAYTLKWTAGFSATARFKRSDFRIDRYLPDVGDEVGIRIEAEGQRDDEAQAKAAASSQTQEH